MARLSKTTPFQIYNDQNTTTPDSKQRCSYDENVKGEEKAEEPFAWTRKDDGFVTESDDDGKIGQDDGAQEGDDEKNYTRTSISSFPESTHPTDMERTPMHKPYTPTYARPYARRMQMSSPLRKGKFGTPYSEPRGSPRLRRRDFEHDGEESKQFPLVLLHITALPMNLPWTIQSMRETLPQHTLDNLQLLKSKLSQTVLKRGILIPHPREDYELLEEKLLETLELQAPRISKCGHYRARHSTDSTLTTASGSTDSGVGSSVDGSDEEHCSTCHHHLRAAGSGKQKWSIKVYAANGLMRASAWSAAWSEMERVDVEIMPWIKDELRIKLDELNAQEIAAKQIDHETDKLRIDELVEERLRLIEADAEKAREAEMSREIERIVIDEQRQQSQMAREVSMQYLEAAKPDEPEPAAEETSTELPNIYRPKDIPLSILLRNYIFLLARKPVNMAIFFLVVTIGGLLFTMGPAEMSVQASELSTLVKSKVAELNGVQTESISAVLEDAPMVVIQASPDEEVDREDIFKSVVELDGTNAVNVAPDTDSAEPKEEEKQEQPSDAIDAPIATEADGQHSAEQIAEHSVTYEGDMSEQIVAEGGADDSNAETGLSEGEEATAAANVDDIEQIVMEDFATPETAASLAVLPSTEVGTLDKCLQFSFLEDVVEQCSASSSAETTMEIPKSVK